MRLGERYYKKFLSIFWKKLVFDYNRIYEKNVMIRMVSNNAVEMLILLSEMEEGVNVTLRKIEFLLLSKIGEGIDEENEEDKKDYEMEQMM
ncbi:hypothetical protein C1645_814338 [Glomus cerebriforme]|uniref:Uncharacterized protein n=1 Tax=Glomus cerebriforme TaxID=658196 RepID=A0A397TLA8_9GLOM|nr:hypothetical protein C1645_814338 [Glomus cerebriforme]